MTEKEQQPIIQLRDVFKAYETGGEPFVALRDINIDIHQGEFLGITGKSGAGKTTLLNMISGVSDLTSGEVLFNSKTNGHRTNGKYPISVHSLNEDKLARWRGENIGIIYQSFELITFSPIPEQRKPIFLES